MSFLSPWPAVWAGIIALPLLVLLYMLRLRRRAVRVSSTILWEEAVKDLQANEPLRRFRWSLLFLLQLLALAALLLAIARPVVPGAAFAADRMVIVLDRSASMRAVDGSVESTDTSGTAATSTRWDAAIASARGLLDELARASGPRGQRPEVMVVAAAATIEPITDFTSNFTDLRTAIESIQPTDQPLNERLLADFLASLPPVEEDIDESAAARGAWRIGAVIISDGGLTGDELARVPGEVTLTFRSVRPSLTRPIAVASSTAREEPRPVDNVGIVALSARRVIDDPTRVRVFARLASASLQPLAVPVVCLVDGTPRDSTTINLPAASVPTASAGAGTGITLGQASLSFELLLPGRGLVTLNIVRPDALEADNSASVLIEALRRPRTLIVAPVVGDAPLADGFLLSALEAAEISSVRVVAPDAYERWVSERTERTSDRPSDSATSLSEFDLVVFDRVEPSSPPNRPLLRFAPTLGSQPADAPRTAQQWRFVLWNRAHPIMRDVALDDVVVVAALDDQRASSLEQDLQTQAVPLALANIESRRGAIVEDGRSRGDAAPQSLILARDRPATSSGPPREVAVGFDPTASNWGPSESFPIFIANAVDWLTGGDEARWGLSGRFATTAEPLIIRATSPPLSPLLGQPTEGLVVAMEGPSGGGRAFVTAGGSGGSEATLPPPTRTGLHSLTVLDPDAADRPVAGAVGWMPVNLLSPEESAVVMRATARWAGSARSAVGLDATGVNALRPELPRHGREIWHYFAIAALIILAVEWIVFARLSRA